MRYFVKYYVWTVLLIEISYSYVFFGPITPLVKVIDNVFLLFFPIIVTALMIWDYPFDKYLGYLQKMGIMTLYFMFLLTVVFLIGLWNPADMKMNEQEEYLGQLGILMRYGIVLFFLGTITITFIRPRKQKAKNNGEII